MFQVKDAELNASAGAFLERLLAFQTRAYQRDPIRAKAKRRFVVGFREVGKTLDRNRARCVIIAPDIERIQSNGGLDDMVASIIESCKSQDLPVFFCLPRRLLGRVLRKKVPVSIVAVRDYQGAEDLFEAMLQQADAASEAYAAQTPVGVGSPSTHDL
jgi:selenocysteine insertion sequence-binding protein 2